MKIFTRIFLLCAAVIMALCQAACAEVAVNEENFPDTAFRAYISQEIDTNHDGTLSDTELAATSMDIYEDIASLEGIKLFTSLQSIKIEAKKLTAIDLSGHTSLQYLECYDSSEEGELRSINLANCTALQELHIGLEGSWDDNDNYIAHPLTTINFSGCSSLERFVCYRADNLTELLLDGCTSLQEMHLYGGRISTLDLSGFTSLQTLSVENDDEERRGALTTLNVSGCTSLQELFCYGNQLTTLDVSGCTALENLYCYMNKLTALDVSGCPALSDLDCGDNMLTTLDVSQNYALLGLSCYSNDIATLDISNNSALTHLYCENNKLTVLDISMNPALEHLSCEGNFIPAFDLSGCPKLRSISCNFSIGTSDNAYDFNLTDFMAAYHLDAVIDNAFSFRAHGVSGDYSVMFAASYENTSYELASMYLSSGKIILHFPNPDALDLYSISISYHNSAGENVDVYVYPASELMSGTAPSITTSSLPDGLAGSVYGSQLTASGTSPFTWTADNLPNGLALSSSGYLSGTPSTAGSYSFTVRAANSAGSSSAALALTVSAPPSETQPAITTSTIDKAPAGSTYSFQLTASGTPPFIWSIKGSLPAGLSMNSSGRITGTPAKKGSKSFTVTAKNDYGSAQKKLSISVYDMPQIITDTLKEAAAGKKYSETLKAKGNKPLKWKLEGDLPDGITFDADKGKFSGIPTNNNSGLLRITLSNEDGEVSMNYTLKVNATPPTIATKKLKDGKYGKSYKAAFKAKGTAPITFTLSGTLPAGLSFDTQEGTITGTPLEACTDRLLTLTAANMGGSTTQEYSLTIQGVKPKITTTSLPDGKVGTAYTTSLEASGTPEITWTASGLPSGLSMSSEGTISGTPTAAGKFKVKITAKNSEKEAKKTIKLTVAKADSSSTGRTASSRSTFTRHEPVNAYPVDVNVQNVEYDYVIVAELGTVSVDEAGMYDFTVMLSDDVRAGAELLWLANSSEPGDDDSIAEFFASDGEETAHVPDNRIITVSAWLNPDRIYTPSIAIHH